MTDTSKDIVLPSSTRVPENVAISTKPCHLIVVGGQQKVKKMFIALERPILETSWLQAKGFFVEGEEDKIVQDYAETVKTYTADKKNIVEVYFPWHTVNHMRNLVYNASKSK